MLPILLVVVERREVGARRDLNPRLIQESQESVQGFKAALTTGVQQVLQDYTYLGFRQGLVFVVG